jgi:hypothetical protein
MDRRKRFVNSTILALLAVLFVLSPNVPAGQVTIIGTVNGTYQIITDEVAVYEVAVTETGGQLGQMVGARVTATGMVYEIAGVKVFMVIEYQVVERYTGETGNGEVKGNE